MMSVEMLIAASALLALVILSTATLRAWQGWLTFKQRELDMRIRPPEIEGGAREGAARIEIADLKERIRKLEAIASGVDL